MNSLKFPNVSAKNFSYKYKILRYPNEEAKSLWDKEGTGILPEYIKTLEQARNRIDFWIENGYTRDGYEIEIEVKEGVYA